MMGQEALKRPLQAVGSVIRSLLAKWLWHFMASKGDICRKVICAGYGFFRRDWRIGNKREKLMVLLFGNGLVEIGTLWRILCTSGLATGS